MTKKSGDRGDEDKNGEVKKGGDEYRKGEELLTGTLKKTSDGKMGKAREYLVAACGRFNTAVGERGFFPEAYYNWGEALKRLAEMDDDEALLQEAVEKFMASGLQFIVDGRLLEKPFVEAQEICPNDKRHRMVFVLYILSIQVIKGKKINVNENALLKDIRTVLTSPKIILILIDTLLGKNRERQSVNEDDELIAIATKILINVILDNEREKPESPEDEVGDNDNPNKLN